MFAQDKKGYLGLHHIFGFLTGRPRQVPYLQFFEDMKIVANLMATNQHDKLKKYIKVLRKSGYFGGRMEIEIRFNDTYVQQVYDGDFFFSTVNLTGNALEIAMMSSKTMDETRFFIHKNDSPQFEAIELGEKITILENPYMPNVEEISIAGIPRSMNII